MFIGKSIKEEFFEMNYSIEILKRKQKINYKKVINVIEKYSLQVEKIKIVKKRKMSDDEYIPSDDDRTIIGETVEEYVSIEECKKRKRKELLDDVEREHNKMKKASPEDKGTYLEYKVLKVLREVYGGKGSVSSTRVSVKALGVNQELIGDGGIDVKANVRIGEKNYLLFVQCKNYYNQNMLSSETVDALRGNVGDMPSCDAIGIIVVGMETGIPERVRCLFNSNGMYIGSNVPIMLLRIDNFIEKLEENILRIEKEGRLTRFTEVKEVEEMIYENPATIMRNVKGLNIDGNGNVIGFNEVDEVIVGFKGVRRTRKEYSTYSHSGGNI